MTRLTLNIIGLILTLMGTLIVRGQDDLSLIGPSIIKGKDSGETGSPIKLKDTDSVVISPESTLPQRYLNIYLKINDATLLENQGDFHGALEDFKDCYAKLEKIQESNPDWETALIIHRLDDCKAKILDLQTKVSKTSKTDVSFPAKAPSSTRVTTTYPWKTNIITTCFWIGEGSTTASAWNENWTQSNNGTDSPQNRNGYAPADHAPTVNTFYVALPFNDLAFPDKASQWLPKGWQRPLKDGKPVSACKDRWVEIKTAQGRICFGQWEDVGPLRNDHAEYVFGDERPWYQCRTLRVSCGETVSPIGRQE